MERLNSKLIELLEGCAEYDEDVYIYKASDGEYFVSEKKFVVVTSDVYALANLGLVTPDGEVYENSEWLKKPMDRLRFGDIQPLEVTEWGYGTGDAKTRILRSETHAIEISERYLDAFTAKDKLQNNVFGLVHLSGTDQPEDVPCVGVFRAEDGKLEGFILPRKNKVAEQLQEIAKLKDVFE